MTALSFFDGDGAGAGALGALGVLLALSVSGPAGADPETKPALVKPGRPPRQAWFPKAPPLPAPKGQVIRVDTTEKLFRAAREVRPGGTILIADGHYMMPRYFVITTDDVTVRGESGDPDRVILDGANSRHGELFGVTRASGVTIADLTIQNVWWNGFKINANTGVHRVTIYNCVIHNIWQRGVKGVPGVPKGNRRLPCRGCRIQYCLFYNDRPKRLDDEPYERAHPERFGGNYIGGIDAMNAKGWVISDNVFIGIHGRTGEARGAIFLWNGSEDCVIERNIIIDCDTGICLGNSHRVKQWPIHCTRFIVRNNFVTRTPEVGILAAYTRDCKVLANTVHHPRQGPAAGRGIFPSAAIMIPRQLTENLAFRCGRIQTLTHLERNQAVVPAVGDQLGHLYPGNLSDNVVFSPAHQTHRQPRIEVRHDVP